MIYLYLKTHNTTGLKYLGKTVRDPFKYKGSGSYWKHHIRKYGYDVTTEILFQTEDKEEFKEKGLYYSKLWNVVESKEFANLVYEQGEGGIAGASRPEWVRKKISKAHQGKKASKETKLILSEAHKGIKHSKETRKKMSKSHSNISDETRKKLSIANSGRIFTEEHKRKISESNKKNKITCPKCGKIGAKGPMIQWHGSGGEKCRDISE